MKGLNVFGEYAFEFLVITILMGLSAVLILPFVPMLVGVTGFFSRPMGERRFKDIFTTIRDNVRLIIIYTIFQLVILVFPVLNIYFFNTHPQNINGFVLAVSCIALVVCVIYLVTAPTIIVNMNVTLFQLLRNGFMLLFGAYAYYDIPKQENPDTTIAVAVVTTIHSMSCDATYRRMVSLCKRAVDMSDETLMGFVTEAYPIVAFCKQLENKERRLMEIMECEIKPDGTRTFRPLFQYQITENRVENGKFIITGSHKQVNAISDSLARRFMENGMPQEMLKKLLAVPEEGKEVQAV